jgi:hypothetical protein
VHTIICSCYLHNHSIDIDGNINDGASPCFLLPSFLEKGTTQCSNDAYTF